MEAYDVNAAIDSVGHENRAAYDRSADTNRDTNRAPQDSLQMAHRIATLRRQRGYSDANYDASPARPPKTLRRQIGQKYYAKKVRNNFFVQVLSIAFTMPCAKSSTIRPYDDKSAAALKRQNPNFTLASWSASQKPIEPGPYDASAVTTGKNAKMQPYDASATNRQVAGGNYSNRPTPSQPYDQSVVIRPIYDGNTVKPPKSSDANFAESTLKKQIRNS